MSELTCDVVFVETVAYGSVSVIKMDVDEPLGEYWRDEGYIELARTTVTVEIKDDTTPEKVEALKAKKQSIAAEAQVKMNNLGEQIQSLLAIEFKE